MYATEVLFSSKLLHQLQGGANSGFSCVYMICFQDFVLSLCVLFLAMELPHFTSFHPVVSKLCNSMACLRKLSRLFKSDSFINIHSLK